MFVVVVVILRIVVDILVQRSIRLVSSVKTYTCPSEGGRSNPSQVILIVLIIENVTQIKQYLPYNIVNF